MPSFSFTALALSLLSISSTSASPLTQRQNGLCNPNFQGLGLSVIDTASEHFEWSLGSAQGQAGARVVSAPFTEGQAEFRFEFTGAPTNTYLIKPLANPELVVAASTQAGTLELAVPNSADPLQAWNVACASCGSPSSPNVNGAFVYNCAISPAANAGLCVQFNDFSNGTQADPVVLRPCSGMTYQGFDFGKVLGA